ncbi:SDR family oxidoreductase [Grimontia sp. S25]|uniref:SDR family oxidoreductase n=1 Tax=Grimontia sedimenti TaxID=2711294 RepID=A0A6M1RDU7_9GAMM|nr:SDR family oxidoreductase [Grimontia sedimenti]
MKILVTGGGGFVGSKVVGSAKSSGWECCFQSRNENELEGAITIPQIDGGTDWSSALNNIDVVVHCAARVHQMTESNSPEEILASYRSVNTAGTLNLAKQAALHGVKRLIFISSIKVNGEFTNTGQPFLPILGKVPSDPYGLSKYEAEVGLRQIAEETDLEVVIIRPPLVYGPDVKANFKAMMTLMSKPIPLPFGKINNQRSLVYIDNLVSLILTCCEHPAAANKTFLVSDNDDVSTTRLMRQIGMEMDKSAMLLPIPKGFIELVAKLCRKSNLADRLCGNLQLDVSETLNTLAWRPPVSFEQGIQHTVRAYLSAK